MNKLKIHKSCYYRKALCMLSNVYVKKTPTKTRRKRPCQETPEYDKQTNYTEFSQRIFLPAGRLEIQGEFNHIIGITVRILIPGLL